MKNIKNRAGRDIAVPSGKPKQAFSLPRGLAADVEAWSCKKDHHISTKMPNKWPHGMAIYGHA